MAVDYEAWLNNPDNDQRRCLLVDAKAYSGGSEVTRKLSTLYAPKAGAYLPVIRKIPTFETQMSTPWGGRSFTAIGEIEIQNDDGYFDAWLEDSWGGRDIEMRLGDPDWAREDYAVIRTGKSQGLEADDPSTLRLLFRDRVGELDKQIQLDTVDDGENGEVEIPLAYGHVFHAVPVLVDSANREYQVHDGAVEDVCVQLYVDGLASGIGVTKFNSTGKFRLASKPSGRVTVEAKGAKPAGTWLEKPGEIMRHIVVDKGGLADPGDIDTAAFSAFDAGAPTIGIYVDRPANILTVLDDIAATNRAWFGFDRSGKFTVGRIAAPTSGASVLTLRSSLQQIVGTIVATPEGPPRYKTRVGYQPVWGRLSLDEEELERRAGKKYRKHRKAKMRAMYVDPAAAEELREYVERGYRVAEYEDAAAATIQTEHLDAEVPEVEETLISSETDAIAEATARQGLFNQVRFSCEFTAYATPFLIEVGDVVTVYDDPKDFAGRFGFAEGRAVTVIGVVETPGDGRVEITGWY